MVKMSRTRRELARTLAGYTSLAVLIVFAFLIFDLSPTVSPVWYGPYLSAANNVEWGGKFLINEEEVEQFKELPRDERARYRFVRRDSLQAYQANPIGFVYVVAAAKLIFPWLADSAAVMALQLLVHVVMCLTVIALLGSATRRTAFFFLYAVNPIVIYFVSNPIYYFWNAIPSFGLALLLLSREPSNHAFATSATSRITFLAVCAALGLMLLVRLTMVGAIVAFFVLAMAWMRHRRALVLGMALFAAVVATGYTPNQKNFWHTPYVGIGAYPNPYMQGLSDDNGYALFERKTGMKFHASLGGPYYDDEVMEQYSQAMRDEYLRLLRLEWPRLIGNAVLNLSAGYSIGYLVGWSSVVHYAVSAIGLLVILLLLYTRQFVLVSLIALTNGTFALYFPPTPAYMYGAYMLLVLGLIFGLDRLGITARLDEWWLRVRSAI